MIVNGHRVSNWHKSTVTYEDIVRMVGKSDATVTFRVLATGVGGTMTPGDVLAVSEDLVINAVVTGGGCMTYCHACGKECHPSIDISQDGRPVAMCTTDGCGAAIGSALGVTAPAPYAGPDLIAERGPAPAQTSAKGGHIAKPPVSADPIELARQELQAIDTELQRLDGLQKRRRRLAAMVEAADGIDAEDRVIHTGANGSTLVVKDAFASGPVATVPTPTEP